MTFFSFAQKEDLIEHDIFAKVDLFRNPLEDALQVAILAMEEMTAFLNATEAKWLPCFALNAFSGLRREEISKLDWSEV